MESMETMLDLHAKSLAAGSLETDQPARRIPLAYLITFTCYGTRVHGDEWGSVDHDHNLPGSPFLSPDRVREAAEQRQMRQGCYELDRRRRDVVLTAIAEARVYKNWRILAVHVRRTHVHTVVAAPESPEKILAHYKSYASRALNRNGIDDKGRKRWSRHGSTRYLWKPQEVRAAIEYVIRGQGEAMAVWESKEPSW